MKEYISGSLRRPRTIQTTSSKGGSGPGFSDNRPEAAIQQKSLIQSIYLQAAGVMQLAGDYSGLMPRHETFGDEVPTGATYHHIISEDILRDVLPILRPSLSAEQEQTPEGRIVMDQARAQWLRTRVTDTIYALNEAVRDFPVREDEMKFLLKRYTTLGTLFMATRELYLTKLREGFKRRLSAELQSYDKYQTRAEILTMATELLAAIGGADFLSQEVMEEALLTEAIKSKIQHADSSFKINKAKACRALVEKCTVEEIERKAEFLVKPDPKPGYVYRILQLYALEKDSAPEDAAILWNPGNIHRGPTSRLHPKEEGYDKSLDDGGNDFEESVAHIISPAHYVLLDNLRRHLADLETDHSPEAIQTVLEEVAALQRIGLTNYKEKQWELVPESSKRKSTSPRYRFVRNEENVRGVERLRSGGALSVDELSAAASSDRRLPGA